MYVCMYVGQTHKDKADKQAHDEMGFEDFFDVQLLRSHSGFHLLHMDEFLSKEGTHTLTVNLLSMCLSMYVCMYVCITIARGDGRVAWKTAAR